MQGFTYQRAGYRNRKNHMEKEMSTEVVFNQEHKTRNAKTKAELCAAVSQKFKKKCFLGNFNFSQP